MSLSIAAGHHSCTSQFKENQFPMKATTENLSTELARTNAPASRVEVVVIIISRGAPTDDRAIRPVDRRRAIRGLVHVHRVELLSELVVLSEVGGRHGPPGASESLLEVLPRDLVAAHVLHRIVARFELLGRDAVPDRRLGSPLAELGEVSAAE